MNQRIKYYLLIASATFICMIYIHDVQKIRFEIRDYENTINDINSELDNGAQLVNQMNQIRQNFIDNKNQLSTYGISEKALIDEIDIINSVADEMQLSIQKIEIDPRNTFPIINQNIGKDRINLERQSIIFTLKGNFLTIGSFLDEIQKGNSVLKINSCSFSLDSLNPEGVKANLEFLAYNYRK